MTCGTSGLPWIGKVVTRRDPHEASLRLWEGLRGGRRPWQPRIGGHGLQPVPVPAQPFPMPGGLRSCSSGAGEHAAGLSL